MPPRGLLFLFEGLDRSGKSTQSQLLATAIDAQLLKFPGNTIHTAFNTPRHVQ